jgi:hypothetical protein
MKLQIETYQKRLPSAGTQITFRPILVKEEKLYIMSKESEKPEDFFQSLVQIVSNCTIEPKDFNVPKMSYNDFIFTFLELRKISKGEYVYLDLFCSNPKCKDEIENEGVKSNTPHCERGTKYNLNEIIKLQNDNIKRPKIIKINDTLGIEMNPTSVKYIQEISQADFKISESLLKYHNIEKHLVAVLKGEEREVISRPEDATEFVESLSEKQIEEITKWINLEPRCILEIDWKCSKCGQDNKIRSIDLLRFLEW